MHILIQIQIYIIQVRPICALVLFSEGKLHGKYFTQKEKAIMETRHQFSYSRGITLPTHYERHIRNY